MSAGLQRVAHLAKLTRYPGTPYPAEGQTWQDCDNRVADKQRTVMVLSLVERYGALKSRVGVYEEGIDTGRSTWIAVKRFVPTSTGYRFMNKGAEQ